MAIPISNVTRRQVYAPSGSGGVGPYAFTFEILANTDIAVYKDDTLLTLTTHYTVTINANGTGSATITAAGLALTPTSPTQYAIVGNRTISRSTDFTTGGDFFANTLNDELDQQTIFAQQNAEGVTRALQAPQTDPTTIDMTLPRSSVRAGKVLSFDASGNPSATEFIGSNRGNWVTGTLYFVRDIVKDTSTSNIFQVTVEHTSVGAQPLTSNAEAAKYFLLRQDRHQRQAHKRPTQATVQQLLQQVQQTQAIVQPLPAHQPATQAPRLQRPARLRLMHLRLPPARLTQQAPQRPKPPMLQQAQAQLRRKQQTRPALLPHLPHRLPPLPPALMHLMTSTWAPNQATPA
jgi:hypothetical protein